MAVSLEDLNSLYRRIASLCKEAEAIKGRIANQSPLGLDYATRQAGYVSGYCLDTLETFQDEVVDDVVLAYCDRFLPSISDAYAVAVAAKSYVGAMGGFDAYAVIEFLNREYLTKREEIILNGVWEKARCVLPEKLRGEDVPWRDIVKAQTRGHRLVINAETSYGEISGKRVWVPAWGAYHFAFEQLATLVLNNNQYSQKAPSELPRETSVRIPNGKLPLYVKTSGVPFNGLLFRSRKTVMVDFASRSDCALVARALADRENISVYMPEVKVDVSELFTAKPINGRAKRRVDFSL